MSLLSSFSRTINKWGGGDFLSFHTLTLDGRKVRSLCRVPSSSLNMVEGKAMNNCTADVSSSGGLAVLQLVFIVCVHMYFCHACTIGILGHSIVVRR